MALKKRIIRRTCTPETYTLTKPQNTHGYIYIYQNPNEYRWILNKRMEAIPKIYLMIDKDLYWPIIYGINSENNIVYSISLENLLYVCNSGIWKE